MLKFIIEAKLVVSRMRSLVAKEVEGGVQPPMPLTRSPCQGPQANMAEAASGPNEECPRMDMSLCDCPVNTKWIGSFYSNLEDLATQVHALWMNSLLL